jgi:hypothetical protein
MAIDHHRGDHIVTAPGEVVGATNPGQSETREGHDTTHEAGPARLKKKLFLRAAAGATALFLVGGVGYAMSRGGEAPRANNTATAGPAPEAAPRYEAFETKDLTMNQMSVPETLDPPAFSEMVQNVGQAIEYAVNKGDIELIRRLIPGGITGETGTLQPGQFELRAAFIKGFRESSQGTGNDIPENPQNERYYAWGFDMELVTPISHLHSEPKNVNSFTGVVRITMGDLPPLPTLTTNELNMEPPHTFEVEAEFTRYALTEDGTSKSLANLGGTTKGWEALKGEGWGLASVGKLYPIPDIMAAHYKDYGFTEVPPLFKES